MANDEEIISFHVAANGADIAVRTNEGHTESVVMLGEEVGVAVGSTLMARA